MTSNKLIGLPVIDDSSRLLDGLLFYAHAINFPNNGRINPLVIVSNNHRRKYRAHQDLEVFIKAYVEQHVGNSPLVACAHYCELKNLNVIKYISSRNFGLFPDEIKKSYQTADQLASQATQTGINLLIADVLTLDVGLHKFPSIDVLMMVH